MNKKVKLLIGIIAILSLVVAIIGGSYNSLATKEKNVDKWYSDLLIQLDEKVIVITNLVSILESYNFNNEVIDKIEEACQNLSGAITIDAKSKANSVLDNMLTELTFIPEYSDLQTVDNFGDISNKVLISGNHVFNFKRDYNQAVDSYNNAVNNFPTNVVASLFGFNRKNYFN